MTGTMPLKQDTGTGERKDEKGVKCASSTQFERSLDAGRFMIAISISQVDKLSSQL